MRWRSQQAFWQNGIIGNMSRRVRLYMPADDVVPAVADRSMMRPVRDCFNATDRKYLGFRALAEMFRQEG